MAACNNDSCSINEWHVLRLLRDVSMGVRVLLSPPADGSNYPDGILLKEICPRGNNKLIILYFHIS